MRFIFNFIFFGILFYLIWLVFPDAFKTLVSWADQIVAYFKELILGLWAQYGQNPPFNPTRPPLPKEPQVTWLIQSVFQGFKF